LRDVRFHHIRRSLHLPSLYLLSRFAWYRDFLAKTSKAR
jgi:hypothetical protein